MLVPKPQTSINTQLKKEKQPNTVKADRRMSHLPNDRESQLKSHNSLRTYTLPRPLIRDGKIVIYDNTVQSQITFRVQWREVVLEVATFFRFSIVFEEILMQMDN